MTLVERLADEGDFRMYLVGKDGGKKMSIQGVGDDVVKFLGSVGRAKRFDEILDDIFARIDTMPMRQNEMKRDKDCNQASNSAPRLWVNGTHDVIETGL